MGGRLDLRAFDKLDDDLFDRLAKLWKVDSWFLLGEFSRVDRLATRAGRVVAVVEAKTRNYRAAAIDPFQINADKILAVRAAASLLGVPGMIVSRCLDGIFVVNIDSVNCARIVKAGRRDRDPNKFPNDYGPRVEIPVRLHKRYEL